MSTVGAYDAKTHLPRLLSEVEKGEVVTITRHGTAIARIVPIAASGVSSDALVDEFRQARIGVILGPDSIAEMIAEGRK